MTGSTIRGVRKGFSSGNFAASRIDDAGETTVVGGNSLHPGSATFQWPPADEVLSSQIAEFAPEVVEGRRGSGSSEGTLAPKSAVPAGESATEAAGVDAQGMLPGHNWHVPARPREEDGEEAEVALRDTPWRVVAAEKAAVRPQSIWVPRIRSYAVSAALVALAVTTVTEGLFIIRTVWRPSAPVSHPITSVPRVLPAADPPASPTASAARREFEAGPTVLPADTAPSAPRTRETPPSNGRMVIGSDPAGAEIVINGRYHGVTPKTLVNVAPGEYRIVLTRDGMELRQTVRVDRGATVSVIAPLSPGSRPPGWIAIMSPIELDVFENGALVGTSRSPQIMLNAGSHTLELVNEQAGFRYTRQVLLQAGRVEQVSVALPTSTVHVNAIPWAEVWIDGKSVGETPIGNLAIAIGPHEIVFRHPELGEKTISTVVKAGAPTRLAADLRQSATSPR